LGAQALEVATFSQQGVLEYRKEITESVMCTTSL
jgi:hypothetical protein